MRRIGPPAHHVQWRMRALRAIHALTDRAANSNLIQPGSFGNVHLISINHVSRMVQLAAKRYRKLGRLAKVGDHKGGAVRASIKYFYHLAAPLLV